MSILLDGVERLLERIWARIARGYDAAHIGDVGMYHPDPHVHAGINSRPPLVTISPDLPDPLDVATWPPGGLERLLVAVQHPELDDLPEDEWHAQIRALAGQPPANPQPGDLWRRREGNEDVWRIFTTRGTWTLVGGNS